ncbi:Crp/Fnr family transcriptional regulator [Tenacibaculum tangerinum]|uniref:Crp/Fnr family transcriptional regulator n=1 Tax=Tenacibaculum tangerinum TaxID=3038772 RepID=A0ABY8L299_9FLAO|nr:Crp/Fnr family transcriptional regulator [Tenacibaculum tangerinum]WGH75564.1 Crp/Fnr family transcriptional regulator [Tenacibaculum tangerinum]
MNVEQVLKKFPYFSTELQQEIASHAILKEVPAGLEIVREGQYIKIIPIVLDGVVRVFSRNEDKELLLYYIRPNESCILSFLKGIENEPSKVYSSIEEDTRALLLPIEKVREWTNKYPEINILFYKEFGIRYNELVGTINQVVFEKIDSRLLDYLRKKTETTGKNPIKISHRQIASELGTAREVITRIIKKLEQEGKIKKDKSYVELL